MPPRLSLPAAALVLAGFWVLLLSSLWNKSATYDEPVHAAAGASYWRWNDYRLNPENGNLPQRVAGLPLALAGDRFSSRDSAAWAGDHEWDVADAWFHHPGSEPVALLREGRAACGLLAVALAALVAALAARRFGAAGGMVALGACVLNPAILANGALMTSDTAAALFLLGAAAAIWAALNRPTAARIAVAGLTVGALFISKMSAFLILPIALILAAARIARDTQSRIARTAAVAGGAGAVAALAFAVIWSAYGLRYSAFAAEKPNANRHDPSWEQLLGSAPSAGMPAILAKVRDHHLLPEAFTYGCAYAWKYSRWRDSFLNGEHRLRGRVVFFPYVALVKTPLPLFGLLALAAGTTAMRWRGRRRREGIGIGRQAVEAGYATLPLWVVAGTDAIAASWGHLDLGQRHILPVYPPLFVLCGAAAVWPVNASPRLRRGLGISLAVLLGLMAVETAARFPDYLSYFNGIVPPSEGYRHLVDSSLDWGQDLPGVKQFIADHPAGQPFHLAYFGSDRPSAYGIAALVAYCASPAQEQPGSLAVMTLDFPPADEKAGLAAFLRAHPEYEFAGSAAVNGTGATRVILLKRAAALRLEPGTYLISATVLQQMEYSLKGPWGPWNRRSEAEYQRLRSAVAPLLGDDPRARQAALAAGSVDDWWRLLNDVLHFDALRFSRLTADLRHRQPDGNIHGSILVFSLTASDLVRALDGPPPELGRDLPAELAASGLLP